MSYTGDRIKQYRLEKGLTQKQLGKLCGIADSNIRKYENGRQDPKLPTIRKIAVALELPLSALVADWSVFSPTEIFEDLTDDDIKNGINPRQEDKDNRIIKHFHNLNDKGQDKAIEQVELLTKIPEYRKDTE